MSNLGPDTGTCATLPRMSLVDTLRKKALEAMKAKDGLATTILRLAQSEVQAVQEKAGRPLSDDEAFAVLRKLLKSNDETLAAVSSDPERTATLTRENAILSELLPKGLGVPELVTLLTPCAEAIKAAASDGQATGVAMKQLKALGVTANGKDVGEAARLLRQ